MRLAVAALRSPSMVAAALCAGLLGAAQVRGQAEPLSSWNDGAARQAILSFVKEVTDKSGPKYVAAEDRIATFDQDGTLWVEHPLYTQGMFALDRLHQLAPKHPEWKVQEPFQAVLAGDGEAMAKLFIDDHAGKPIGINLFIGKRPYAAFGNSGGDREMLEWTGAGAGARLKMLVLHDDAKREYAYGPAAGLPDTKVGMFSQSLMDEAAKRGWTVISMKKDWKKVFAFEK